MRENLVKWSRGLLRNPDLDLFLLVLVALVFSVLGVVNLASPTWVMACVLALLAALAMSQIRSRHQVAAIAQGQQMEPLGRLLREFPPDLEHRRNAASDVLLVGVSLSGTVQSYRRPMRSALARGARVRVLLLDPCTLEGGDDSKGRQRLKVRIQTSLNDLDALRGANTNLEIRLLARDPSAGFNILDPSAPDGLVVVQHYEFQPASEGLPILALRPADGSWFGHFVAEAERMWAEGAQWPHPEGSQALRVAHPGFQENFGPELDDTLAAAQGILITGVARNTLFTSRFKFFEEALRRGCLIRVVLQDPECAAVETAAERYYAERSVEPLRNRIRHTRQLLTELHRLTNGHVELRYTTHPLAVGAIAVVSGGEPDGQATLFLEYFTYQVPGEPKFILAPNDGPAHTTFGQEAEALWAR
jgi:hypothetical protein